MYTSDRASDSLDSTLRNTVGHFFESFPRVEAEVRYWKKREVGKKYRSGWMLAKEEAEKGGKHTKRWKKMENLSFEALSSVRYDLNKKKKRPRNPERCAETYFVHFRELGTWVFSSKLARVQELLDAEVLHPHFSLLISSGFPSFHKNPPLSTFLPGFSFFRYHFSIFRSGR